MKNSDNLNPTDNPDVRFSTVLGYHPEYMKPFEEQLKDFADKEKRKQLFGRDGLLLGTTPKILQDLGLPKMPVAIDQEHVSYAIDGSYSGSQRYIDNHTYDPKEFAKLPDRLADPVAVIADLAKNDLIVYVELINIAGTRTIVPFRIVSGMRFGGVTKDVQRVKSVYGNELADNDLTTAIVKDSDDRVRLYYLNKNKIPSGVEQAVREHGVLLPNGIIHKITDDGSVVKPKITGMTQTQQFRSWFGKSKIVNKDGSPKIVYHQTARDFWMFSTDSPVAGKNDSETPNGIFFKENDHDIGIGGARQMACYLRMENPLHFTNREEANNWYCQNVAGYKALQDEMEQKIKPIDQEVNRLENEMFGENVDDAKYEALKAEWDKKHDEMKEVEDGYRGRLRDLLNDYFLNNDSGYDGIILDYDAHRYVDGKRENVKSYIVFNNTQVKSATDNVGIFDKRNPDIRYSTILDGADLVAANRQLRKDLSEMRAKLKTRTARKEYGKGRSGTMDIRQIMAG